MHILKDENGNLCHHGHEHEHEHGEIHKTKSILQYMLDHNIHHAEELEEMSHELIKEGKEDVAKEIRNAVSEFNKANDHLKDALVLM